jgi:hypothetical protein
MEDPCQLIYCWYRFLYRVLQLNYCRSVSRVETHRERCKKREYNLNDISDDTFVKIWTLMYLENTFIS